MPEVNIWTRSVARPDQDENHADYGRNVNNKSLPVGLQVFLESRKYFTRICTIRHSHQLLSVNSFAYRFQNTALLLRTYT